MKIAIIIPWFGKGMKGGAEQHAWQVATRLAARGEDVTVLTTCSKEFLSDWSVNFYKAGKIFEDGLEVIRFPIRKRNHKAFDELNQKLLSLDKKNLAAGFSPLNPKEEAVFVGENINSPELIDYLKENASSFDAFIFIPYLYGPIINGLVEVADKAVLIPCLHDEPYAYLNKVTEIFFQAKKLLFLSEGEYKIAEKLYGPSIIPKATVIGAGVEIAPGLFESHAETSIIGGKYILCLGRRDEGKNTHLLINSFVRFIKAGGGSLKLVIAGPGDLPVKPRTDRIMDLGLVSEDEKINLIKYCAALVNPSVNESFSRVIFEAWLAGRPVVVNTDCFATYMALDASGFAGWHAGSEETFAEVFSEIEDASDEALGDMGARGRKYAANFDWNTVIGRYISEMEALIKGNSLKDETPKRRGVAGLLSRLAKRLA